MLKDAFRDSEMESTLTKGLKAGFSEGAAGCCALNDSAEQKMQHEMNCFAQASDH